MLKKIPHDISKPVGLNLRLEKIKVICNKHINKADAIVDAKKINGMNRYIYFGRWSLWHDQVQEMRRRIGQEWSAFCKMNNIMVAKNVRIKLKRKAFNECILPVMTYGCETWSLRNTELEKLVTRQSKIERLAVKNDDEGRKEYKFDPETE